SSTRFPRITKFLKPVIAPCSLLTRMSRAPTRAAAGADMHAGFSRALSPVAVARDKRKESLRGAEQARERSLVVLCGGADVQSPAVDGLQADAPEPFGSTAGSCRPQVQ